MTYLGQKRLQCLAAAKGEVAGRMIGVGPRSSRRADGRKSCLTMSTADDGTGDDGGPTVVSEDGYGAGGQRPLTGRLHRDHQHQHCCLGASGCLRASCSDD